MKQAALLLLMMIIHKIALANGSSIPVYIDGKFQTDPSQCKIEYREQPNFYIVNSSNAKSHKWHENFLTSGSNKASVIGKIPVGSLAFVHPDQKHLVNAKNHFLYSQLAAKSSNVVNSGKTVSDGVKGYLASNSLQSPNNWALSIYESYSPGFASEPVDFLNGKILTLYRENGQYVVEKCCRDNKCKDYSLFNVFSQGQPIGFVAFNPGESSFLIRFRSIQQTASSATQENINEVISTAASSKSKEPDTTTSSETGDKEKSEPSAASLNNVVCTSDDNLVVRDESLDKKVFGAPRFSSVKLFQGWGENQKEKTIDGTTYSYAKAQFDDERIGWVALDFIKDKDDCPGYEEYVIQKAKEEAERKKRFGEAVFPLTKRPTHSYTSGKRQFNAERGNRKHAAADLKRPMGDDVVGVTGGKVLRKYAFKRGTWAIETKLDNGLEALYGEVTKSSAKAIADGTRFEKGEKIGEVGKLGMLHFELYSGDTSGVMAWSRYKLPYQRRSDLIDPTPYLKAWEKNTF